MGGVCQAKKTSAWPIRHALVFCWEKPNSNESAVQNMNAAPGTITSMTAQISVFLASFFSLVCIADEAPVERIAALFLAMQVPIQTYTKSAKRNGGRVGIRQPPEELP